MINYINHFSLFIFYYLVGKSLNYSVSFGTGVVVRRCTCTPAHARRKDMTIIICHKNNSQTENGVERAVVVK